MTMAANRSDIPPQRLVRHVFWKYPVIAAALLAGISVVALVAGSPNAPRETIAEAAARDPGGWCSRSLTNPPGPAVHR